MYFHIGTGIVNELIYGLFVLPWFMVFLNKYYIEKQINIKLINRFPNSRCIVLLHLY